MASHKFFNLKTTKIRDLKIAVRNPIFDQRGYFERLFCINELNDLVADRNILQINRSFTEIMGTVRGLHYQIPPKSEMKLVSCIKGEIFDVSVDLRKNSRTFLNWHGEKLSESNNKTILIPEGFAHGFQTLSDNVELIYFHTALYDPNSERGINPVDSALAIDWPLEISQISNRDKKHPFIDNKFSGIQ